MKSTGTLIECRHCNKSAIGVVRVTNPKHERQKVLIPKSSEDCVTTMPNMPVLYITFPLPKKNIKNTHVITAKIIGIVRNLIYDLTDILAIPNTKMPIRTKTTASKIKLSKINVRIINPTPTRTFAYTLVSDNLLL